MNRLMSPGASAPLLLALALDLGTGEPPTRIHPVVGVGKLLGFLASRAPESHRGQLAYGAAAVGVATLAPAFVAKVVIGRLGYWPLRLATEAWLLKTCFAYRALEEAGRSVAEPLADGDLPTARKELRALVSRDHSEFDETLVSAAAIESLAENLSDGFAAPLMAYALGGTPAAVLYRAANTADSMIGYRGEYEYLGKAAARLDDALNLLPARLTAALILAASGPNAPRAWRAALQDHKKTPSPNAGWPISAMAGSMDISLQKPGVYHLNENARKPGVEDVYKAITLCRRAAALCGILVLTMILLEKKRT